MGLMKALNGFVFSPKHNLQIKIHHQKLVILYIDFKDGTRSPDMTITEFEYDYPEEYALSREHLASIVLKYT
jgi:hypothetical protein